MASPETPRCWCPADALEDFGAGYLACAACGTLIRAEMPAEDITRVRDEKSDLYGREYWYSHQAELGLEELTTRRRSDLTGRCLYWLRTLLAYKPGGRLLELGAAHGGLVALAARAGFDARGLELSPAVAAEAEEAFGITMLRGPLEDQELEAGSFDAIVAMDVLEHLPDPLGTLERAAELLAADGILVIQTPCRPSGSLDELHAAGHRFPEMLIPEHLYLFSQDSVRRLLGRAGLPEVVFEPALFDHYDMFLVAGREPLERREIRLPAQPEARVVQALLDLDAETRRLTGEYQRADEDRIERARQIEDLHGLLEKDRRKHLDVASSLRQDRDQLAESTARQKRKIDGLRAEKDRLHETLEHRQAELERRDTELERQRGDFEHQREELGRQREELQRQHQEIERQDTELERRREDERRLLGELEHQREELGRQREELERQRAELTEMRTVLSEEFRRRIRGEDEKRHAEARVMRLAGENQALRRRQEEAAQELEHRDGEIAHRDGEIAHRDGEIARRDQEIAHRDEELGRQAEAATELEEYFAAERDALLRHQGFLRHLLSHLRASRLYRAMVRLGRWRDVDEQIHTALSHATPPAKSSEAPLKKKSEENVESLTWTISNGPPPRGSGPIAIDLTALLPGGENGGAKLVATSVARNLGRLAPEHRFELLTTPACHDELAALEAPNVRRRAVTPDPDGLARTLADEPWSLLFCPTTAPPWSDPRVPQVALVHDLQFLTYPEFFDDADRAERHRAFERAVHACERIVTVSDYVRGSVLRHAAGNGLADDRVVTVHNGLAWRFQDLADADVDTVLRRFALEREGFLLYPANFWPHKNHRMLLTAFGQYRNRGAGLKLVLTGAERPDPGAVCEAVERMGLGDEVRVTGYVSDSDLAALLSGCRAVVFPSLYEGFGMPVAEAMAHGRPVACSRATGLPEVAGAAALYFDPRKPAEIATAMERLADDDELVAKLVERGRQRLRDIGDSEAMARSYLGVIEDVLASPRQFRDALAGPYADGWTPGRFVVSHGAAVREIELGFDNPRDEAVSVKASGHSATIAAGQSLVLRCHPQGDGGYLEIDVEPTFQPEADSRQLGLRLKACRLHGEDGVVDLLAD